MTARSDAQQLRRQRERFVKRKLAYSERNHRMALSRAETNEGVSEPSTRQRRAQKDTHLVRGQTGEMTSWRNGSEYVCLVCKRITLTPAAHEVHMAVDHLGCGIEVKWFAREPRFYEGAGLVIDLSHGFNVWKPA